MIILTQYFHNIKYTFKTLGSNHPFGDFGHVGYGSSNTDNRGRALEQMRNLSFLNIGTASTCIASESGSVINITAITNTMKDIVHGWKVSKRSTNLDHNLI